MPVETVFHKINNGFYHFTIAYKLRLNLDLGYRYAADQLKWLIVIIFC